MQADEMEIEALNKAMNSEEYKKHEMDFNEDSGFALNQLISRFGSMMYREGLKDGIGIKRTYLEGALDGMKIAKEIISSETGGRLGWPVGIS